MLTEAEIREQKQNKRKSKIRLWFYDLEFLLKKKGRLEQAATLDYKERIDCLNAIISNMEKMVKLPYQDDGNTGYYSDIFFGDSSIGYIKGKLTSILNLGRELDAIDQIIADHWNSFPKE